MGLRQHFAGQADSFSTALLRFVRTADSWGVGMVEQEEIHVIRPTKQSLQYG